MVYETNQVWNGKSFYYVKLVSATKIPQKRKKMEKPTVCYHGENQCCTIKEMML